MARYSYEVTIRWTGDRGTGTSSYDGYARDHVIESDGAPPIAGSSDLHFRGTPGRWTPEELFLASLSACHELWYLHLCSEAGVSVRSYRDRALGIMLTDAGGGGRFTQVTLRPEIVIDRGSVETARRLHEEAHAKCFIASSVAVPIVVEAVVRETTR